MHRGRDRVGGERVQKGGIRLARCYCRSLLRRNNHSGHVLGVFLPLVPRTEFDEIFEFCSFGAQLVDDGGRVLVAECETADDSLFEG